MDLIHGAKNWLTTGTVTNIELLVNAGRNIVNNYFDQNRLFAGLGYQFTASLNAHIGYLHVSATASGKPVRAYQCDPAFCFPKKHRSKKIGKKQSHGPLIYLSSRALRKRRRHGIFTGES